MSYRSSLFIKMEKTIEESFLNSLQDNIYFQCCEKVLLPNMESSTVAYMGKRVKWYIGEDCAKKFLEFVLKHKTKIGMIILGENFEDVEQFGNTEKFDMRVERSVNGF